MADDGGTLVPFPRPAGAKSRNESEAQRDELTVRVKPWSASDKKCEHVRSWIDREARKLICRDCGVELDVIDVLHKLAQRREAEIESAQRWRRERDSLIREVEQLHRQEKNAKSRIRNARRRRDDRQALEAAAQTRYPHGVTSISFGGYQPWEKLSEPQREVVVSYVQAIVETYLAELEHPLEETG